MSRYRRRRRCAPIESLEVRRMLSAAVLVVNTLADDNAANSVTSLREAVALAQAQAGDDEITFDPTVFAQGSQHSIVPLGEPIHFTGAMGKVTINGPGTGVVALDGSQAGRSFDIDAAADVEID